MSSTSQTAAQSIRISARDFNARLEEGDSATILDMRSQKAWDASDVIIPGAVRVPADKFQIEPSWPKERLTVVY